MVRQLLAALMIFSAAPSQSWAAVAGAARAGVQSGAVMRMPTVPAASFGLSPAGGNAALSLPASLSLPTIAPALQTQATLPSSLVSPNLADSKASAVPAAAPSALSAAVAQGKSVSLGAIRGASAVLAPAGSHKAAQSKSGSQEQVSKNQVPALRSSLNAAAQASASVLSAPGSAAGDKIRADFTLPQTGSKASADAVSAAPGQRALSSHLKASDAAAGGAAGEASFTGVPEPSAPDARPFVAGTFANQAANNALQATMPMLLLQISDSVGPFAAAIAGTAVMDSVGTLVGGWLSDRWTPKTLMVGSTIARFVAMAGIPVMLLTGTLTIPAVMALFLADAFARGVADTARHTVPIALVGKDKAALSRINSKHQLAFDSGALVGPLSLFVFLTAGAWLSLPALFAEIGHFLVPAGFAAAAFLYALLPNKALPAAEAAKTASADSDSAATAKPQNQGMWDTLKRILGNRVMLLSFMGVIALTLYPLRTVLPGLFGEFMLGSQTLTPLLVGLFGAGGIAGSLLYGRIDGRMKPSGWLLAAAAGTLALALAVIPGNLYLLIAGILAFSAANVAARLSMVTALQSSAPDGMAGRVMGTTRFGVNLAAFGIKSAVAGLFVAVAAPQTAFWALAAGLGGFAAALVFLSKAFRKVALAAALPLSTPHGYPGKLIVVEGLDGSGKSTQMDLLKRHLESQGLKVVMTSANSSQLMSDAVKRAKKARELTPQTFSLSQATDLADRLDHVIVPALKSGAVVLADRYAYTGLARDHARNMKRPWLRSLYGFAPKPDLVLYFRLPVATAVGRVLARSSGKLTLSEDFEEEGAAEPSRAADQEPTVKYYEGGLDMALSDDPVENFHLFQQKVTDEYDRMAPEFGFRIVDASRGIEEQQSIVLSHAMGALGNLDGYLKRPAESENIFDKDPAGDSEQIRANYQKKKRGLEFYFRNAFIKMQERFEQLLPHALMPVVFLHGNAHLDNYVKTLQGAAMADFDRARFGPYAWDLARMMVAISVVQKNPNGRLVHPSVLGALKRGYLKGFRNPEKGYEQMRALRDVEPQPEEMTVKGYVRAEKKWVLEMRERPMAADDAKVQTLVKGYFASRKEEKLLEEFEVAEAGRGLGSMGERDRVVVLLKPKGKDDKRDWILLDIKQVRVDGDSQWYTSPYKTESERMQAASELYAPGWGRGMGRAFFNGVEYEVRQIPTQSVKLKRALSIDEQEDFAYAVGTQLGRGHRLSLKGPVEHLERHVRDYFDEIAQAAWVIKQEIEAAHRRYLGKLNGGKPAKDA